MTGGPIKVLILEDNPAVADALAVALNIESDFSLASTVEDATVAVLGSTHEPLPDGIPVVALAPDHGTSAVTLPNRAGLDDLLDAIRSAVRPDGPLPEPDLSPRELEVLRMLADGVDPAATAKKLGISTHTARQHVKNIRRKLAATSVLQAVAEARRRGILRRSR